LNEIISIFKHEMHILLIKNNTIHILLHEKANDSTDILKAFLHAYILRKYMTENTNVNPIHAISTTLQLASEKYNIIVPELETKGWTTSHILLNPKDFRANWNLNEK
jgi:hypothetical protein